MYLLHKWKYIFQEIIGLKKSPWMSSQSFLKNSYWVMITLCDTAKSHLRIVIVESLYLLYDCVYSILPTSSPCKGDVA